MSGGGGPAALAANRRRSINTLRTEKLGGGSAMDTWSETRSLIVLMAVIAVFYVLGRALAEML
jgi:hypothetical protein